MAAVRLQVTHTTWISSFFVTYFFQRNISWNSQEEWWSGKEGAASFVSVVGKGSTENSECHLQERNYVSRCAKCNSIALWVFPLTCSFWCIRVVLRGFNQLSSYTVNLHSYDDSNLHSVISGIIIYNKKHDLMLMFTWTRAQSPGDQESQWPSVLYQE